MTLQVEFQAVVLAAGKGSRMPELTAVKPKCLLPVGSKPLVWYPLYKLQQSGFSEVILIIQESQRSEIQSALERTDLSIKIDYVEIPGNEDLGTADSLRFIHDKIISDVVVLSCDLVSDVNLKGVIDLFRTHNATITSLLLHPQKNEPIVVPGPKSKHKIERDLIGVDTQTNRLVFLASASDFESELSLPRALLKKHTNIKMYSNLIDSHIYVIKKWVIVKYLCNEESISTIKGELLPYIIKKQLSKPKAAKPETNISVVKVDESDDMFSYAKENHYDLLIRETSSYNDHYGDMKPAYNYDPIRCYAYIADSKDFGVRINTLLSYWTINNQINDRWDSITNGNELVMQNSTADIKSNQVDDKCIIWDGAKLKEKTSFKNSIIGSNSEINSFSRVFNSIIMNNVTIKEKVALENCIVCEGAVVESGSSIKNCLIGSHHTVAEKSEFANEVLTDSDRLMEF